MATCVNKMDNFLSRFKHPWKETAHEIWKWPETRISYQNTNPESVYKIYTECVNKKLKEVTTKAAAHTKEEVTDMEPKKVADNLWEFKGFIYEVTGFYNDEESKLLILEEFDKERQFFEKLQLKFGTNSQSEASSSRPRIPENVRIEVWRRDGGKCARCDSRTNLEYDHIVPISKGGSNTARNIELLCEKCNRSKSSNVV